MRAGVIFCKYKLCFTDDYFHNLFVVLTNGSSVNVKKIITVFKVKMCIKYFMFKYCNIYKMCVYFFEKSSNPKLIVSNNTTYGIENKIIIICIRIFC